MATLIRYKATGHTRLIADFAARRLIASGIATAANADVEQTPTAEQVAQVAQAQPEPVSEPVQPAVENAGEQTYETRALKAEPAPKAKAPRKAAAKPAAKDKPKKTYSRRDLKPKD
jgi:hypothetical protein